MNKVILMSIRPEWLVKILNGEKTIEIRKTTPKCELPIDVYLCCTKGKPYITQQSKSKFTIRDNKDFTNLVNGLVVAKFTLNKIGEIVDNGSSYLKCKTIYAWHIDNLEIFDKPIELREFSTFKRETISCGMDCPPYTDWVEYRVRKAPQNWQYVYKGE